MKYVSIDIETSGLAYNKHCILEFGAVIEDTENEKSIEELPKFNRKILSEEIFGDIIALSMNKELIVEIAEELKVRKNFKNWNSFNNDFCVLEALEKEFIDFLTENGIDVKKSINAAGKNFATFDKLFLEKLFEKIKFSSRVLDPGNLYFEPSDERLPDFKTCLERAGINKNVRHRALDDALDVVKLIRHKVVK